MHIKAADMKKTERFGLSHSCKRKKLETVYRRHETCKRALAELTKVQDARKQSIEASKASEMLATDTANQLTTSLRSTTNVESDAEKGGL